MVGFVLRIYLMGLVILVPERQGADLAVLLQEVRNEQHMHFPVLIWEDENQGVIGEGGALEGGIWEDGILTNRHDGKAIATNLKLGASVKGFLLDGRRFDFTSVRNGWMSMAEGAAHPWYSRIMGIVPEAAEEVGSVGWIPHMSTISKEAGHINKVLLEQPAAKDVAALLQLSGVDARLRVAAFSDINGQISSLTFRKPSSQFAFIAVKQAAADIAVIDIPIMAPSVTLSLRAFDASTTPKIRSLDLHPTPGSKVVEVLLGNLTPLVILPPCESLKDGSHFALYYRASTNPNTADMLIPFVGMRSVGASEVEDSTLPKVIKDVSGSGGCVKSGANKKFPPVIAGASRPICTLVVMEP